MRRSKLTLICVSTLLAAHGLSASFDNDLITTEAMDTYRTAIQETDRNRPKAHAMLKGLLLDTLTVAIDRESIPFDSPQFETGVRQGIDVWNEVLNEKVFVLTRSTDAADVVIRFVPKVKNEGHAQGYVQAKRQFSWRGDESTASLSGSIQIRDNVGRRYMNANEVMRVTAHELGHLLGLNDQPNGDGLMSDFVAGPGRAQPSRAEVRAVLDFRALLRRALTRP